MFLCKCKGVVLWCDYNIVYPNQDGIYIKVNAPRRVKTIRASRNQTHGCLVCLVC